MNNNFIYIIGTIFLLGYISVPSSAQTFGGGITAGINASQIRGDELSGFDKAGISAGFIGTINTRSFWYLRMELLYSQRGSSSSFTVGDPGNAVTTIALDYAEMPVIFAVKDWEVTTSDNTYHKMHFIGGLQYSRLVNAKVTGFNDDKALEEVLRENDLSFLAGFILYVNPKLGVSGRYVRSINKLYSTDKDEVYINDLLGFYLSFKLEYIF